MQKLHQGKSFIIQLSFLPMLLHYDNSPAVPGTQATRHRARG